MFLSRSLAVQDSCPYFRKVRRATIKILLRVKDRIRLQLCAFITVFVKIVQPKPPSAGSAGKKDL